MNHDRSLERSVATTYKEMAPPREPAGLLDSVLLTTGHTRQRPRWLALIKEPPMRLSSSLAVGSPSARMAAIVLATLLLTVLGAGAVFTGSTLLAASAPLVVAQDGSGTHMTVIDAVVDAEDGDTVLVKPGTYQGTVVIDKDITLRGDGPREDVILEFGRDSPKAVTPWASVPYGVLIVDSTATVSDLTVRGPNVASAFVVVGGSPTIEHVANELQGDYSGAPHSAVGLIHGASPTISDNVFDGPIFQLGDATMAEYGDVQGTSRPTIVRNHLDSGIWVVVTDGALVSGNRITNPRYGTGAIEIELRGGGSAEVSGNSTASIYVIGTDGTDVTLRDNVVEGGGWNDAGITLGPGSPVLEGNTVSGARTGIVLEGGGTPTIRSNEISGNTTGIRVTAEDAAPLIEDNAFCGNETDLAVPEGSTLLLDSSNEVCPG